ncbi:hypothetical protein HRF57_11810 [Bacillus safensis]|uniref:hypothetical protein n=1 Tax=Bacillus safensis TaxID=561879 RepID=UPI00155FAA8A|nr:hypothetical protein [Bacillus safensis]NRF05534.1 hypothetical protein [Bacillus safensis]
MLWGKREQYYLWITAYIPLFLIMVYRFIDSLNLFGNLKNIINFLTKPILELIVVLSIVMFSYWMYKIMINWLLKAEINNLENGIGEKFAIRNIKKLSPNDYTFFLFTLLLPLFSLDYGSFLNLLISLLIIGLVIIIYVKTDFISICPLFFTTGYHVYRAIISQYPKEKEREDPSVRIEAIIISKKKYLDLDDNYRAVQLVSNIYLIVKV